jgi:hypothetical protein
MGIIIDIIKINFFILANHFSAVKELNNELNRRLYNLNENVFTAEIIKINLSTFYDYIYLMIEVKLKIKDF